MASALEFNEKISQNSNEIYFTDAAVTDAYVITLVPAVTAYVTGQVFNFKANTANTGAATLNVNALGAIAILKHNDVVLEDNDIEAGQIVTVVYDGVSFQMQSQVATGVAATQAQMETGTATNVFATPGRQQYHESACKAWMSLNGTGAAAVRNAYNMTLTTDHGAGDYSFAITTNFSDADYSFAVGAQGSVNEDVVVAVRTTPVAAGSIRVQCFRASNGAAQDATYCCIACYGDQA